MSKLATRVAHLERRSGEPARRAEVCRAVALDVAAALAQMNAMEHLDEPIDAGAILDAVRRAAHLPAIGTAS